jgi:hypothetical protein
VVVVITRPPANGEATVRKTDVKPDGCAWTVPAMGVFYKSKPGFAGTDQFAYERKPDSGGDTKSGGVRNVTVQVSP